MRLPIVTPTAVAFWLALASGSPAAQTGLAGSGAPVSNMQPSLAMNFITRLDGDSHDLGEVVPFAGSFAPAGWAFAHGQTLPIAQNEALFQKLGPTYGGNGITTFALPDLRGRAPLHRGMGVGLTNRTMGSDFGTEATTLSVSQMPGHSHVIPEGGVTGSTGGPGQLYTNLQPSLGMNYAVSLIGTFPSETLAGAPPFVGQVRLYATSNLPSGYVSADGQLLPINQNTSLFAVVGDYYGGNPPVTFALPDLRGRVPIHVGGVTGMDGLELGDQLGTENVSLAAENLPSHAHSLPAPATTTDPTGAGDPYSNMQPSLALNYIICIQGIFPSPGVGAEEPFLGQVALFAGDFAPKNWAFANGQILPVSQNTALFAILGTSYGGNGVTTFALPDLRGRTLIGAGQGTGLSPRDVGEEPGSETTALLAANLPPHAHSFTSFNADFDEDGDIDGGDFLRWQRGQGVAAGATHGQGDANADGEVDDFDLAVWESQYGNPPPLPARAVPEPSSAQIAAAVAAILLAGLGKRVARGG